MCSMCSTCTSVGTASAPREEAHDRLVQLRRARVGRELVHVARRGRLDSERDREQRQPGLELGCVDSTCRAATPAPPRRGRPSAAQQLAQHFAGGDVGDAPACSSRRSCGSRASRRPRSRASESSRDFPLPLLADQLDERAGAGARRARSRPRSSPVRASRPISGSRAAGPLAGAARSASPTENASIGRLLPLTMNGGTARARETVLRAVEHRLGRVDLAPGSLRARGARRG